LPREREPEVKGPLGSARTPKPGTFEFAAVAALHEYKRASDLLLSAVRQRQLWKTAHKETGGLLGFQADIWVHVVGLIQVAADMRKNRLPYLW
jgi:hypothetical protein